MIRRHIFRCDHHTDDQRLREVLDKTNAASDAAVSPSRPINDADRSPVGCRPTGPPPSGAGRRTPEHGCHNRSPRWPPSRPRPTADGRPGSDAVPSNRPRCPATGATPPGPAPSRGRAVPRAHDAPPTPPPSAGPSGAHRWGYGARPAKVHRTAPPTYAASGCGRGCVPEPKGYGRRHRRRLGNVEGRRHAT